MSIFINVVDQKMHASSSTDGIVAGSQNFVKFRFNLSKEWDGLVVFAQFRQGDTTENRYLDKDNTVFLPHTITKGTCTLMLYGTKGATIGTTNFLTLKIDDNNLVYDAESTEISQSLYDQLVSKVDSISSNVLTRDNIGEIAEEVIASLGRWTGGSY